jgi:disulfide bond formation protein DsbB
MTLLLPRRYFAGVVLVSTIVLGIALIFKVLGGLFLCELCRYQQVLYMVVIVLGSIGILASSGASPSHRLSIVFGSLCAVAFFANFGIAWFQAGVEYGWWRGFGPILIAPTVPSVEATWSLLDVSMAGWNGLIALALGLGSLMTLVRWQQASRAHSGNDG